MATSNKTVQPITGTDTDQIITTLNHNFQVLTERIKALNITLSYLDILKVAQIFSTDSTDTQKNLEDFTSQYWSMLANYAGVYIQSSLKTTLFTWQGDDIKRGGFIIKLPDNQSLYLPGAEPTYFVPGDFNSANNELSFTQVEGNPDAPKPVKLNVFPSEPTSALMQATSTSCGARSVIRDVYRDCRFYDANTKEEIIFSDYQPETTFTIPTGAPSMVAYYFHIKGE